MHTLQKPPHIFRLDIRRNPMPQIRDPPPSSLLPPRTQSLHLFLYPFFPSIQHCRVKVSLEVNLFAYNLPDFHRVHGPIEAQGSVPRMSRVGEEGKGGRGVCALGEKGDRDTRVGKFGEDGVDFRGDVEERREGKSLELVRSKFSSPGVEYLEHLHV